MALAKETLYKALYNYAKEEIEGLDTWLKRLDNESITANNVISYINDMTLINVLASLRQDIREQANKKAGKGNINKAMQAVIKGIPEYRPNLKGYFMSGENNDILTVCDGYRIIRSFVPLDVGELVDGVDVITSIIAEAADSSTRALELPTLNELKAFIKLKKAEQNTRRGKDIIYSFGDDLPAVNAQYLLDILTAFPKAKAFIKAGDIGTVSAIYFVADNGDAVLLPIRRQ